MIRVAVADDDVKCCRDLAALLDQYAKEHALEIDVKFFHSGQGLLDAFHQQFQIVLLDIEMPNSNGLETAQRIRALDKQVTILFVTSYAQYAIDGYEVDAAGFIVKPVSPGTFMRQMDKAVRSLSRRQSKFLILKNTRDVRRIDISDILFIEISGHYVLVHTKQEDITFLTTLKSIEEQLSGEAFYRINSGTLVHLPYVEGVTQQDVMIAGQKLPISRVRKKGLLDALLGYLSR